MADRVNYAAWASRIGRARSLDEVGERVAAIRPRAQTNGDLGDKPSGPVSFASESDAITCAYTESCVKCTSDRSNRYLLANIGRKQRLNG